MALAPTRRNLRRAIKLVNRTLNELKVEKHPDKTFIGRIERGFGVLGTPYHSSASLSWPTSGDAPACLPRL
jgi:RNA-directed DNA polymerase